MAGHSHWAGIKHKKEEKDQKRGVLFSKLLKAISAAAQKETDPNFNPRLRTAIKKAEEASVPEENIKRAINKASIENSDLEELLFESYGPGGVALLISVITSSHNRSVSEIKKILNDHGAKWAEPGSVIWIFEDVGLGKKPRAKFFQNISDNDLKLLKVLLLELYKNDDVFDVYSNTKLE